MRTIARVLGACIAAVGWLIVCLTCYRAITGLRASEWFVWITFCVVAYFSLLFAVMGHRMRAWGQRRKGEPVQTSLLGTLSAFDQLCDGFTTLAIAGIGAVMIGGCASVVAGVMWVNSTLSAQRPIAMQPVPIVARPAAVIAPPVRAAEQPAPIPFVAEVDKPVSALNLANEPRPAAKVLSPAVATIAPAAANPEPPAPTTKSVSKTPARISPPPKPGPDYVWVKPFKKPDGKIIPGHWEEKPKETAPIMQVSPSTSAGGSSGRVWVDGYTRKDGVKVKGHWRNK